MHTAPMTESAGDLNEPLKTECPCRKCEAVGTVTYQIWESHCGGYEDLKFDCAACGATWWVDGPDA